MIDKRDLRVGNLLKHGEKIVTVKEIGDDGINFIWAHEMSGWDYDYVNLFPIELTPEWLEKCGFDKEKSNDTEERDVWTIQVANNTSLYYDPELTGKEWYLSLEWNNNHWQNEFWANPKYIHQVQNLFYALTGEELTIKSFNQSN